MGRDSHHRLPGAGSLTCRRGRRASQEACCNRKGKLSQKEEQPPPRPHPPHSLAQGLPEAGTAVLVQLRGKSVAGPSGAESG